MTKSKRQIALITVSSMAFYQLFWGEGIGINLLLYTLILIAGVIFSRKDISIPAIITGIGSICAAAFWVWNATTPALLGWIASLLLFAGFVQHQELKSILHAYWASVGIAFQTPMRLWKAFTQVDVAKPSGQSSSRWLGIIAFPILAFIVFFSIFRAANPTFEELTNQLIEPIGRLLSSMMSWTIFGKALFITFGCLMATWLYLRLRHEPATSNEGRQEEVLFRRRKVNQETSLFTASIIALKNEYTAAAILMGTIGSLACMVNLIDLSTIWFGFEYDGTQNLSQLVHEGTYLLIWSILLSMGIMLYYFRGNQNFYRKGNRLRWLAYLWLAQNVFMVLSVAIRNYHYIHYFGLAYKRIGVLFFLGLTLFGLWSLFWKIKYRRSIHFLLRTNSWAAYSLLLLMGTANWDPLIAQHNLTHWNKEGIDFQFLLELSDKALPVLDKHSKTLEEYAPSNLNATRRLENRLIELSEETDQGWRSWTWADSQARQYAQGIDQK